MTASESDRVFFRELAKGYAIEKGVADELRAAGITVDHGPLRIRPTYDRRVEYRNQKDLILSDGAVIEVKSSSRAFTSPDDVPFDPVMVATVSAWDEKAPKPCAVVVVSQPTAARVVIPGSSRPSWVVVESRDYVRDIPLVTYRCPRRLLRTWSDFVGWLRDRGHR